MSKISTAAISKISTIITVRLLRRIMPKIRRKIKLNRQPPALQGVIESDARNRERCAIPMGLNQPAQRGGVVRDIVEAASLPLGGTRRATEAAGVRWWNEGCMIPAILPLFESEGRDNKDSK